MEKDEHQTLETYKNVWSTAHSKLSPFSLSFVFPFGKKMVQWMLGAGTSIWKIRGTATGFLAYRLVLDFGNLLGAQSGQHFSKLLPWLKPWCMHWTHNYLFTELTNINELICRKILWDRYYYLSPREITWDHIAELEIEPRSSESQSCALIRTKSSFPFFNLPQLITGSQNYPNSLGNSRTNDSTFFRTNHSFF